jgi:hypothetical protein
MTEQNKQLLCPVCNGNDLDAPCAYTTEKPAGCLRAARLLNKQPTAEAGVVYLLCVDQRQGLYEFVKPEHVANLEKIVSVEKLYTSQTTATQAAVAAAMGKALDSFAYILDNPQVSYEAKVWVTLAKVRVANSIPAEATAALRELMMDCVSAGYDAGYTITDGTKDEAVDRILAEKWLG